MIYNQILNRLSEHNLTAERVLISYTEHYDIELKAIFNQIYQWLRYEERAGLELTEVALTPDELLEYFMLQTVYRKKASQEVIEEFLDFYNDVRPISRATALKRNAELK